MTVSVITPALPTRLNLLVQAMVTVQKQTLPPLEHLVGIDIAREGTGAVKTGLLNGARGEWVATLEDDDLFLPDHLAILVDAADKSGCDIVYSYCRVDGTAHLNGNINRTFHPGKLREGNYIPSTALIRRDLAAGLGGWRNSEDTPHGWEDWDFWLRALDAGAQFGCVPTVTWIYRFHHGNKTWHGEKGAH